MHDERGEGWLPPEAILDALLHPPAHLAGDILEINPDTWAIHGSIPVDGEVILAEFDRWETAHEALARLAEADPSGSEGEPGLPT